MQNHKRFVSDLLWNYGSIAILAVSGLAFSFIVASVYDAATLGVFNQGYAYYMMLSQFAVCGVHLSVIRHIPMTKNPLERQQVVYSALCAVGATAFFVIVLLFGILTVIGGFFETSLIHGMLTLLPGIFFFALNKTLLAYLNGLSEMKPFAVFQSLRNILIAGVLLVMALAGVPGELLLSCFSVAEGILFIITICYLGMKKWLKLPYHPLKSWIFKHLRFGLRIMPGNLVLEFNSRIDIICLGFMLQNDALVGFYSFASLFTDGFYQVFVVIRRNINPMLTASHEFSDFKNAFYSMRSKVHSVLRFAALPAAGLLILGYSALTLLLDSGYQLAILPLAIMSTSIALSSRAVVFGNLMAQCGYPTEESVINIITAATNFFLNIIFIYLFGLVGAAVATAVSYFAFAVMLQVFTKRRLGPIKLYGKPGNGL